MYPNNYLQHYQVSSVYNANAVDTSPYLQHHGVVGMRWGQHIFGKVKNSTTGRRTTKRANSLINRVNRRRKLQEAKKIKEAEQTLGIRDANGRKESKAKRKARVLKSRSAQELYKHADLFTYDELNEAYSRLALEKRIRDLDPPKQQKSNVDKWIDRAEAAKKLSGSAKDIANNGIGMYNAMATIYNATNSSGKTMKLWKEEKDKKKDKKDDD